MLLLDMSCFVIVPYPTATHVGFNSSSIMAVWIYLVKPKAVPVVGVQLLCACRTLLALSKAGRIPIVLAIHSVDCTLQKSWVSPYFDPGEGVG